MTVKELIVALSKMPPNADVEFGDIRLEVEETDSGGIPYAFESTVISAVMINGKAKLHGHE